jgi:hypothetical protein
MCACRAIFGNFANKWRVSGQAQLGEQDHGADRGKPEDDRPAPHSNVDVARYLAVALPIGMLLGNPGIIHGGLNLPR